MQAYLYESDPEGTYAWTLDFIQSITIEAPQLLDPEMSEEIVGNLIRQAPILLGE